ncbi:DUF3810 domain-containing protein [Arenibacter sp. F20364]|uniref:DUF3810 domain-containing protein n=1 Tax=Arenibacter sp. F20364 TaxID=2926415 RepID=UPI001FF583C5|nr:DUF3810 domain-containing protein [Arenibacter sp. F20364]MCK0190232.1 DUF3810 domain-containing protein [Arenibacter sp. F20364]
MNTKIKNLIVILFVPQIILVKWLGQYPEFIETYYSRGIYPVISWFWRTIMGWIPFSVGDLLYALLIILGVRYIVVNRMAIKKKPLGFLRDITMVLSIAYFTFHLLWGLNYYREPLSKTLGLGAKHSQQDLVNFIDQLVLKTNELQFSITADTSKMVQVPYSKKEIMARTIEGYQSLENKIPLFAYRQPSLKKSVFSIPLSYMGYGGYLNPFTNEAQANSALPNFRFPVICGHEIGHQLGFSAENETNFIGYMATVSNEDIYFKYSAYAYALSYCLNELVSWDQDEFNSQYNKLNPGVKKNYKELAEFWEAHENPMEPVFKSIFNTFLKANNQKDGIRSYNAVVTLLVSYYQKNPL